VLQSASCSSWLPDCDETVAHVAHMNAFLNGNLREKVYMQPPPGYSVPDGMVCHLRRSLYGRPLTPGLSASPLW
jgi:hypothetical protein